MQRFTLDRIKKYVDQGAYFGARNVLLVVGEYFWDNEVFPGAAIWDMAKAQVKAAGATVVDCAPLKGARAYREFVSRE